MMEHYSTQAIDDKNLWRQHLREIALKQTEEREAYRSKRVDSGKVSQGNWQQLFLQGWQLLFTLRPLPTQDTRRGLQENPSEEAPARVQEHSESCKSSLEKAEKNQEIWATFRGSSEEKKSEEGHEKKETDTPSAAGTEDHKPSQVVRCGTEIRPKAPIVKTELSRDDLVLPEKEFPSWRREAIALEAPAFIASSQERGRLFGNNPYKESWSYQTDEHPSIKQDWLPEAPRIKYRRESLFKEDGCQEDLSIRDKKRDSGYRGRCSTKRKSEWRHRIQTLRKEMNNGPGAPAINSLNKELASLFSGEDRYLEGTRAKVPDQMLESSFKGRGFFCFVITRNYSVKS